MIRCCQVTEIDKTLSMILQFILTKVLKFLATSLSPAMNQTFTFDGSLTCRASCPYVLTSNKLSIDDTAKSKTL